VQIYLDFAGSHGIKIEHVILTHLHADFVSGHRELADKTGAQVYVGQGAEARFAHVDVKDGDHIQLGQCDLSFLQTPGHTVESVCIVLTEPAGAPLPKAVFTGDTLFVGDVGRPDLSPTHTPQQLAELLYSSLHEKLLKLPDEVVVYPAHGAGSLCGRQMGEERFTTIGKERRMNYALQAKSREEFVHLLTDSLPPRPEYFERDVELNRQGAGSLDSLPPLRPLSAEEVLRRQTEGALVLDTRPAMQFAVAHVPGSVHIALTGQFASWMGRLIGLDKPIIIAGEDPDHVRETQIRLARVGIENVLGYLADGVTGWIQSGQRLEYIPQISAQELVELRKAEGDHIAVLDVREPGEVAAGKVEGAINIPLTQLKERVNELDREKLIVVNCKGGYRSAIATSLLRQAGLVDIANLTGGYDAWKALAT
jgi:glyoxylase-like metal-dependent hydrolase (beta-lactamase superfamily II)/rhodanese-related sulfurtransferase